ncbi:MAG: MFS transporter, partial [Pseudonocardia sediminis]
ALIVGVPAGALLGQMLGWRSTFWAVALVSLSALAGVLVTVPGRADGGGPAPAVRQELRALRRAPVVLTLLVGALVNGGTFAVYTYLAPLLTGAGGLGPEAVPVGLALFGIGSLAGVTLAGRLADTHYRSLLLVGGTVVLLGWVALALPAGHGRAALVLVAMMGAAAFTVGSAVIARSLTLASGAPTLGGSATTAALNVGATAGPLVGGWSLSMSATGPAWAAAGLTALAAVPAVAASWSGGRRAGVRTPPADGRSTSTDA